MEKEFPLETTISRLHIMSEVDRLLDGDFLLGNYMVGQGMVHHHGLLRMKEHFGHVYSLLKLERNQIPTVSKTTIIWLVENLLAGDYQLGNFMEAKEMMACQELQYIVEITGLWTGKSYPGRRKVRRISTTDHAAGGQPAGWGLSSWGAKVGDTKRDTASSWVHGHVGDEWPMDWVFERVETHD